MAQSTSVSVNAKTPFPAESVEKVPLDPTWPPCGHAGDPEIGSSTAVARVAARCLESVRLPAGCPSEIPKSKESAPVIDCTCSLVRFSPGWVVESRLHDDF